MPRDDVIAVCNSKGIHDCISPPYSIKTSEIFGEGKKSLFNLIFRHWLFPKSIISLRDNPNAD